MYPYGLFEKFVIFLPVYSLIMDDLKVGYRIILCEFGYKLVPVFNSSWWGTPFSFKLGAPLFFFFCCVFSVNIIFREEFQMCANQGLH